MIDVNPTSITITLEAVETVTVPAGTFNNALRLKVYIDDGVSTYTERICLAKGVGPVQMHRVSEINNTDDCFFTCGSFNSDDDRKGGSDDEACSRISINSNSVGHV